MSLPYPKFVIQEHFKFEFGVWLFQPIFALPEKGPERCLSGRKERFAKPSYGLNCTEGSNPSLSARIFKLYLQKDGK